MLKQLMLAVSCAALTVPVPMTPAYASDAVSGSADREALCARSIILAGVEQSLDARIQAAITGVRGRLDPVVSSDDKNLQAYYRAVEGALGTVKGPILAQLQQSCVTAFTVEELEGINSFYASAAGKAWLEKGRTVIMPAMEQAVAGIEPRLREDVELRYCAELGLDCS